MPEPPVPPDGADDFVPWLEQRKASRRRSKRTTRARAGVATFGLVAVVVLSGIINPPTASVHSFTKNSDYDTGRQAGCTNSGKGCHGAEKEFKDFNAYHASARCTTCHDYQGIGCIPCHKPSQTECEACHDGTMKGAPDVVRLTDPYPRGHYRETSHTVQVAEFGREMRSSRAGKAKATCADCHSADLKRAHEAVKPAEDSTYGDTLTCVECHNDTRTSALDQVKAKWKTQRCEDCHGKKSSVPMHSAEVAPASDASSAVGCEASGDGCHDGPDLHALHPDAPKSCAGSASKGEPGCHELHAEARVPTATACGEDAACHRDYPIDDFGHGDDDTLHSAGPAVAEDTSYRGIACGECHHIESDGRSLQEEHALPTSARQDVPDNACRDCHNHPASQDAIADEWPARDTVYACGDCHGRSGLGRGHSADADLASSHASESPGCAATGPGCHPTADLTQVGVPTTSANIHSTCLRCHDASASGGNGSYDPSKKTCGTGRACHSGCDVRTAVHRGSEGVVDGADPAHTARAWQQGARMTDPLTKLSVRCDACHDARLGPEHARPNSDLAGGRVLACVRCHDATSATAEVVKTGWTQRAGDEACAACHGTPKVPEAHLRIGAAHLDTTLDAAGSIDESACVGAGCHATVDVRLLHAELGCTVTGCHAARGDISGRDVRSCGGVDPQTSCHTGLAGGDGHETAALDHTGVELDESGKPTPGFCARSGCHSSLDLRKLHRSSGCGADGCHTQGAQPKLTSCGGADSETACHVGFTADEHFVDHSADMTGTVDGISYGPGRNLGCFGCHSPDLRTIHTGTAAAPITGGGINDCRVCHYDALDPGSGSYSGLAAVAGAVASHDKRCTTCHASNAAEPNATSAASAHKRLSAEFPPPLGFVTTDPAAEWRAAFESPAGGGHNVLPASAVGASSGKSFPLTAYAGRTWALPPNAGVTQWLRDDVFPGADTPAEIRSITIICGDCHDVPAAARGPHGSAVPVSIDPDYSQTEYSRPSRGTTSQFAATGTDRVVCFKCHNMQAGSVPGTDTPGGSYVHAQHAQHPDFPDYHPGRYGEKCVDCHVRIPHAWRHARLLVRTMAGGDGVPPDTYPYVVEGHRGLAGVLLQDFSAASDPPESACVTGGCHGRHDASSHPMPADVPGRELWP